MVMQHKLLCFAVSASVILFPGYKVSYRNSLPESPSSIQTQQVFYQPESPNNQFHPARYITNAYRHNIPKKVGRAIRKTINDLETLVYSFRHPKDAHWQWGE